MLMLGRMACRLSVPTASEIRCGLEYLISVCPFGTDIQQYTNCSVSVPIWDPIPVLGRANPTLKDGQLGFAAFGTERDGTEG